jgi:hypothetical protein
MMVRSNKMKKQLKRNEGILNGFNNYKVMANLDLATLVAIFPSRIVEVLGHYMMHNSPCGNCHSWGRWP